MVGLGYVGLPLATVFAEAGYPVTVSIWIRSKQRRLIRGESYIPISRQPEFGNCGKKKLLQATNDFSVLKDIDLVSICVPNAVAKNRDPDLSFIISAAEKNRPRFSCIAEWPSRFESSTYPGTTRRTGLTEIDG